MGEFPSLMIRKLAHLCFFTHDLGRLVGFYRDGLGLAVKFRFYAAAEGPAGGNGEVFGAYVACGDTTFVEIFDQELAAKQWGGGTGPLVVGGRFQHLCFEVTGLGEFRETLVARGVSVGEIRRGLDGSLQAWCADPDGNRIELMEYTHGCAQVAPGTDGVVRSQK